MSRFAYFAGGTAAGFLGLATFYKLSTSFTASTSPDPIIIPTQPSFGPGPNPTFSPSGDPHRPNDLAKIFGEFGFPGPVSDLQYRQAYVASYNRQLRNANWVVEHMTEENLRRGPGAPDRGKSTFREDPAIPPLFQSKLKDYFRSGYDRGHLVAAADAKKNQEAMDETFYLSNISPQVGSGFNRDYWAHLEQFARDLTKRFKDVYVFTGPLYLPSQDPVTKKWSVTYEVIGNPPNVAVPTHFFKVFMVRSANGTMAAGAFVLPNTPISDQTPLEHFSVPIPVVERAAGINLFQKIPDRDALTPLCRATKCDLIIRKFEERARK